MNKRPWIYIGGFLILVLDQFLKWYSIYFTQRGGFFNWRVFEFGLYKNEGIAFGIRIPIVIFYLLVVVVIFLLIKKFKKDIKSNNLLVLSSLILIGAGALSNIGDRIFKGYVVDYLHFFGISAINLADIVIVCGILLLIAKELGLMGKFKRIKNLES